MSTLFAPPRSFIPAPGQTLMTLPCQSLPKQIVPDEAAKASDEFNNVSKAAPTKASASEPDPLKSSPTKPALADSALADTDPPVDKPDPPADETDPPSDETDPPSDETDPPADETDPPADETDPPADETDPPADETEPMPAEFAETVLVVDPPPSPALAKLTNDIVDAVCDDASIEKHDADDTNRESHASSSSKTDELEIDVQVPVQNSVVDERVSAYAESHTIRQLKDKCKKYGINGVGKKIELTKRILSHESQDDNDILVIQ